MLYLKQAPKTNKIEKPFVVLIYCVPLHRNLESINFI